MTFRVGMKVVCIAVARPEIRNAWIAVGAIYPKLHAVYTVREIIPYKNSEILRFVEINNAGLAGLTTEPGFKKVYFRPAVSPKSEISFTTGAPIDSERFDNRKRVLEPIPVDGWLS